MSKNDATAKLSMPVMSAPVSIRACTGDPVRSNAVATSISNILADHACFCSTFDTKGFVNTDNTLPSEPGSY